MPSPVIVKKYANRRLYTTDESRYISLAELAEKIRSGTDVQVIDAKTGADLTQSVLTQIVIEHRGAGKLLSVRLLTQLIRLGDDAFSEFVSQFMTDSMQMYLQMRSGMGRMGDFNPFLSVQNPFTAWFERWRRPAQPAAAAPPPEPEPEPAPERTDEISAMRRELDDLKTLIRDTLGQQNNS